MNGGRLPGFAVPNGIAMELLPFDTNPSKRTLRRVLFCGALNYPPNRRGLEWFYRAIWPWVRAKDPDIRLAVVGYGAGLTDFADLRSDSSVDFIGEGDNVVPHYNQTSLSVVPLLEGSGTRVKNPRSDESWKPCGLHYRGRRRNRTGVWNPYRPG
jgi:hypothetical protein